MTQKLLAGPKEAESNYISGEGNNGVCGGGYSTKVEVGGGVEKIIKRFIR